MYWINEQHVARDDAHDIYQDVFLAISRNVSRFERQGGTGTFRRWLKVITKNKVNDHFRRMATMQTIGESVLKGEIDEFPGPQVDEIDIDQAFELTPSENATIVQSVMRLIQDEFHENTWKSFWLTAVCEMSAAEAAIQLNLTPAAVRKNKSRVVGRLREALAEYLA
jgi:RNA polymerase sigma-70 factor (ECF subfamily)